MDPIFSLLIFLALLLPFQFALNPLSGFDLGVVRVIIPLFFIFWLFKANKQILKQIAADSVFKLLLVFLLLTTASLFFSHNIFWSLRKLAFLFSILPLYFVIRSSVVTVEKKRKFFLALVSSGSLLALIGIFQFSAQFIFGIDRVYTFFAQNIIPFFLGKNFSQVVLTYPSWLVNSGGKTYLRAFSIFPDPHMFAYFMGMLIPISLTLWSTATKHRSWLLFCAVLLIAGDILSFTRGAYVALIASSIFILPLVNRQTAKKLLFGCALIGLTFILVPANPVASRLASSVDTQEGSNQGRISNWQQAFQIISNNPQGVGIGMYSLAVEPQATYREPIYAHSLYLDLAAELGILTAIIFIVLLHVAIKNFWVAKKNPFSIACVCSLLIFSVHSIVENPLFSIHVLTLFTIILALSFEKKLNEESI